MNRWQLLVPVKGTTRAKTRLGDAFGSRRSQLALAFARDTVAAAARCPAVAGVTVTTGDAAVAAAFAEVGIDVFEEFTSTGLNAAIVAAAQQVAELRDGVPTAVLLGDLPALRSSALERALALANAHPTAFVPDAKGTGSTLLCARDAALLRPRFGANSARAHEAAGALSLDKFDDPRLLTLRQDVDDVADLRVALRLGVGEHTRECLLEIGGLGNLEEISEPSAAARNEIATATGQLHS